MKNDKADLIYKKYYNQQYRAFILSDSKELTLRAPAPTTTPWNALSSESDLFSKETCFPDPLKGKVHFIKKNEENHAVVWETKAETLKAGVRWGIVKAESITGQVISTLGHYRIIAHERIVMENKLMVSNTQAVKLALLDVYQDRCEFLQNLESLVNTHATKARFDAEIRKYKDQLEAYKATIPEKFKGLHLEKEGQDFHGNYKGLNYSELTTKIIEDLDKDITNAENYRIRLESQESTSKANRARGYDSVLDFVKRQMHKSLYEFQGLNQDVVFAVGAFSRGEMNDCIEDARDLIDKHKPDLRNAVTQKHHGMYGPPGTPIVYDFAQDGLSPAEERQALMAISFIEGWDVVDYTTNFAKPMVINQSNPQKPTSAFLTKIFATKWNTHRDFGKALYHYIANWIKGTIYPTQPWEGEVGRFHTYASELIAKSRPTYPLWMKGWHFLKAVGIAIKDTVRGIRNFGQQFTIYLRLDLQNDWASSKKLAPIEETFAEVNKQIEEIKNKELKIVEGLDQFIKKQVGDEYQHLKVLAETDYHLSYGEEHDLLTAMVQAFGGFAGHFTHNLFTKDPVGALIFTSAFMVGGVSIFYPLTAKTFFGSQFVDGFHKFSELVGAGTSSKAFCGSLTFAQLWHLGWGLTEGPSSEGLSVVTKFLEDPLTAAFLFTAAYGIGYALAHAPLIGDYIREELGTSDILNYPVIGVKLGVGGILILVSNDSEEPQSIEIPYNSEKLNKILQHLEKDPAVMEEIGKMLQRIELVQQLAKNAPYLAKLKPETQFDLERQIDAIFKDSSEQAISLKKLIYPETDRSVAYQALAVPFGYIPAVFRLVASLFLSTFAWLIHNPESTGPMSYAGGAMLRKIAKDLSRIYTASSYSLAIGVNIVASPFKALLLVSSMLIGRITAFAEVPSGHFLHKGFWFCHNIYCRIGEILSFTRLSKSVVFADPVHTVYEVVKITDDLIEGSYNRFGKSLVSEKKQDLPIETGQGSQYEKILQPPQYLTSGSLDATQINQELQF